MTCPVCADLHSKGFGHLTCTLHGGYLTATEVGFRYTHAIVDGAWVERKAVARTDPHLDALLDAELRILRQKGMIDEPGTI